MEITSSVAVGTGKSAAPLELVTRMRRKQSPLCRILLLPQIT